MSCGARKSLILRRPLRSASSGPSSSAAVGRSAASAPQSAAASRGRCGGPQGLRAGGAEAVGAGLGVGEACPRGAARRWAPGPNAVRHRLCVSCGHTHTQMMLETCVGQMGARDGVGVGVTGQGWACFQLRGGEGVHAALWLDLPLETCVGQMGARDGVGVGVTGQGWACFQLRGGEGVHAALWLDLPPSKRAQSTGPPKSYRD